MSRSLHLGRVLPLVALIGIAGANGTIYSPIYDSVSYFLYNFMRGSPLFDATFLYYATSLLISALTVMLAALPAALYERVRGLQASTPGSLLVWLGVSLLMTLPTLRVMVASD